MQPAALPYWAEQQAAALLGDLGGRWTHVQAVVAQAHRVSGVLTPEDRPFLIAAAWVHDIGYAPPLNVIGFHPVDGARYVSQQGHERLASLVAHHSGAQFEAEERGLVETLAAFKPEDGPLLDALTCADMTVGPAGQSMLFEERIADILNRYPPGHPVHRALRRSRPLLRAAVERTRERLAAAADQPMYGVPRCSR